MKRKNLKGRKFGNLTVLEDKPGQGTNARLKCKCVCGNVTTPFKNSVLGGHSRSCGCLKSQVENLVGRRFGMLKVIESVPGTHDKCECKCGKVVLAKRSDMKRGVKTSCGCRNLTLITINGDTKSLTEWAGWLGVTKQRVSELHKQGRLIERLEKEVGCG